MASQKGGVGKTTICINLAYSLAKRGWRILLVDSDPQGAVGLSLARSTRKRPGFHDVIHQSARLQDTLLVSRMPELSILPTGLYDPIAKQPQLGGPALQQRISDLYSEAQTLGFDIVITDTAAGLTGLTELIIKASQYVLIPQQCEPLAARSIPHMLEALARFRTQGASVRLAGILLSMVMETTPISAQVAKELREALPAEYLLRHEIPRLTSFLDAAAHGIPVALLHSTPPPEALLFDLIAAELEQRTGIHRTPDTPIRHASLLD
jgi:chromosome partitioning protein